MLTPLSTCICSLDELFIAVNNMFLVVISSLLPDFLRTGHPPFFSTLCFTHIRCDFWQLLWNMKSCHWLSLVAQAGRGLCRRASEISLLSSTAVSVQWPHAALACRHFPLSSSSGSHDISPQPGQLGEGRRRSGVVVDRERSWRTEGRERGWGFGFSRR